jgi:GTP cyclohydrolase I
VREILAAIGEDPDREGLLKTPGRVEAAYRFLTRGYQQSVRQVVGDAVFEDGTHENMVLVRDIQFYSLCEHHLLPFFGKVHVAYVPNGRIIGLSKIPRLVAACSRRLQVQEHLTSQIANALESVLRPQGLGVVLEARHLCMEMRGARSIESPTKTSAMRGIFRTDARTRKEFLDLIKRPQ